MQGVYDYTFLWKTQCGVQEKTQCGVQGNKISCTFLHSDFIHEVVQCKLTDAMNLNACMTRNKTYVVCKHMICDNEMICATVEVRIDEINDMKLNAL